MVKNLVPVKQFVLAASAGALLLSGCARSVAVERVKMGDAELSCAQLLSEIQEADKFRKAAEDKKGFTGTNTAAVLLFWPALFVTYSDANEAIRAADERKVNLTNLYHEKHCDQTPSPN
jgi:hypothetical protein